MTSEIEAIAEALSDITTGSVINWPSYHAQAQALYVLDVLRSAGFVTIRKSEIKHLPIEWQDFLGFIR